MNDKNYIATYDTQEQINKGIMKVLVSCEESQEVCKAFRELGHEAYSCDIQECSGGHPEWHLQVNALELLKMKWDLIIAHPPCTYMTNAGAVRMRVKGEIVKERYEKAMEAKEFFMAFYNSDWTTKPEKHTMIIGPNGEEVGMDWSIKDGTGWQSRLAERKVLYVADILCENYREAINIVIEPLEETMKPRICEVLGVDVGEKFEIKNESGNPYHIIQEGYLCDKNGWVTSSLILDIINEPEKIVKLTQWTDQEVQDAKTILRMFGVDNFTHVTKDPDGWPSIMDGDGKDPNTGWCMIGMEKDMFPSLKPGHTVALSDIIGGAE